MSSAPETQKKNSGKFTKGQSGNPLGRPSRGRTDLRQKLEKDADKVLAVVMELALAGDMAACKLILDRTVPTLKPKAQPMQIAPPDDRTPQGLAKALIDAAMNGQVEIADAATMLNAINQLHRMDGAEANNEQLAGFETLPYVDERE
jgi:hypothetical protein